MIKKLILFLLPYKIRLELYKLKWRKKNFNNETEIFNIFNFNRVSVGKKSYGKLKIYMWDDLSKIKIGNFVSIGEDTKFILGGNHSTNIFSTYPFKVKYNFEKFEAYSKGDIIIEDDVWIGQNVIILSGVKIGKGAVIGTGSLVAKDIPSYAICVGNPCEIVKYRFSSDIIKVLEEINLEKIDLEFVKQNIDILYTKLDLNILNKIKYYLDNKGNTQEEN